MVEMFINNTVTKSLAPINSDERFFEGYLTVEIKDKQGEITIVDELYKVLPVWMDRGAPISDTHSNRIIGKGINFARTVYKSADGTEIPAIKITGKIHKNYELDNEIWGKIKSGEYKGLSFGGATKSNRTPKVLKDGSVAYQLTDLEHYEVAVCKDPAVPLALITDYNPIAKSMVEGSTEDRDGKMVIRCSKFGCRVNKADLSGIETFEGKVEALMDEGKSRQSAENIVGSFTKKDTYAADDERGDEEDEIDIDKIIELERREKRKDSPTGHDPTQVTQSPDSPRDHSNSNGDSSGMYNQNGAEQRVGSKKADYSDPESKGNTDAYWKKVNEKQQHQADNPLDYNEDGDYEPQNCPTCGSSHQDDDNETDDYDYDDEDDYTGGTNKADYSTDEAKENTKRMYEDAKIKREKEREEHYKKCPTCGRSDADHDEDDDDYINRASPNPISEAGEIKTHPDKKLSNHRRSLLRALKHKAFDIDMQWKIIDIIKDIDDEDEQERIASTYDPRGEVSSEHGSHNTPNPQENTMGTSPSDREIEEEERALDDEFDERLWEEVLHETEKSINILKDAMSSRSGEYRNPQSTAKPKEEGQSHGKQSTDTRINTMFDERSPQYSDSHPLRSGRAAAPIGSKKDPTDKEMMDKLEEGLDTGNPATRGNYKRERGKAPKTGKAPRDLKRSAKAIMLQLKAQLLKEGTGAANGTSPRGGDYSGTQDDGKFNVRHNGGRKTNTHGKKAEDLGNFP